MFEIDASRIVIIVVIAAILYSNLNGLLLVLNKWKTYNGDDFQFSNKFQQQMTSRKSISLLTFNVFLRPPPIKTNEDDYKEQRFAEIKKVIKDYDIVCLQEMFQTGTFRLERIIEFAIENKFYYWKMTDAPSFGPGPVVDSGLLVLSKYPILSSEFMSYKIGILSDSASDKGYIYCRINVRGETLHLFMTHLQASYMEAGMDLERQLSVKVRLKQSEILIGRIVDLLKQNKYVAKDLVMLVGDLNINSKETPFRLTLNSYLASYKLDTPNLKDSSGIRQPLNQQPSQKFDMDLPFSQYEIFQRLFHQNQIELIDHVMQRYGEYKATYGDNEKILTGQSQSNSQQRLDYIFTLVPTSLSTKREESRLKARTSTCTIQQFKRSQEKYGQLSDHYGISIDIQ